MSDSLDYTIQDFLSYCEGRAFSPHTLSAYRNALGKFQSFAEGQQATELGKVTPPLMRSYLKHCTELLSPGGAHARLRPIRTFFNWLVDEEILEKSPMKRLNLPSLPKQVLPAVREADLQRLFTQAGKTRRPLRDQALLAVLFDTGMRASELCSLRLEDLLPSGLRIMQGKGGKDRIVPASRLTLKYIRRYVDRERAKTSFPTLFLIHADSGLNRQTLSRMLERLCDTAKLPKFTPHTFRRGFAVSFLQEGGNVFSLQRILGHSTLEMSNRYAALQTEDLARTHQQASPLDRALGNRKR